MPARNHRFTVWNVYKHSTCRPTNWIIHGTYNWTGPRILWETEYKFYRRGHESDRVQFLQRVQISKTEESVPQGDSAWTVPVKMGGIIFWVQLCTSVERDIWKGGWFFSPFYQQRLGWTTMRVGSLNPIIFSKGESTQFISGLRLPKPNHFCHVWTMFLGVVQSWAHFVDCKCTQHIFMHLLQYLVLLLTQNRAMLRGE